MNFEFTRPLFRILDIFLLIYVVIFAADAMVSTGLAALGYQYINIGNSFCIRKIIIAINSSTKLWLICS